MRRSFNQFFKQRPGASTTIRYLAGGGGVLGSSYLAAVSEEQRREAVANAHPGTSVESRTYVFGGVPYTEYYPGEQPEEHTASGEAEPPTSSPSNR